MIAVEAVGRFSDPPSIEAGGVLGLGLLGLAGNVAATLVLARGQREDINLEGVLRHSAADALGSIGVVVAGGFVLLGGSDIVDPIVSLLIAALVLASSWRLIKEPFDVLMESAPADLDVEGMGRAICGVEGVSLGPRPPRLDGDLGLRRRRRPRRRRPGRRPRPDPQASWSSTLHERFGIEHTTLQMEEEAEQGLLHVDNAPEVGRGGARRTLAVRRAPPRPLRTASATPVAVPLPRSARRSGLASLAAMPLHRAVATALVTVAAALAALLAAAPASPAADLRSQLEAKESKLDQVRHRKGVLTTTIARDKARIERLTDEVAAVRTRDAAVRERLAAKQAELRPGQRRAAHRPEPARPRPRAT